MNVSSLAFFWQVVHDVALQKLPVRFAMDRAGLVGADGPTHAGAYDITYIASLPNFVVMAPSDEAELCHMIATANSIDWGPSAFRYPRGAGTGIDLAAAGVVDWKGKPLEIGKGRIVKQGADVAILGYGTGVQYALVRGTLLYCARLRTSSGRRPGQRACNRPAGVSGCTCRFSSCCRAAASLTYCVMRAWRRVAMAQHYHTLASQTPHSHMRMRAYATDGVNDAGGAGSVRDGGGRAVLQAA